MWIVFSLLNLLQYCFYFVFWFYGHEECGILAPWPGIEPELKDEIFTPGPPEMSQEASWLLRTNVIRRKLAPFGSMKRSLIWGVLPLTGHLKVSESPMKRRARLRPFSSHIPTNTKIQICCDNSFHLVKRKIIIHLFPYSWRLMS